MTQTLTNEQVAEIKAKADIMLSNHNDTQSHRRTHKGNTMTDEAKAKAAVEWLEAIWQVQTGKMVDSILELLRPIAAGTHVIVPIEPTVKMCAAGWIDKEDVDPDEIYAAMIAASQEG